MMRFPNLARLLIASAVGLWAPQALAQAEFYDQYGIYPLTPKGPPYGLGAVMIGYFDSSGKQLRVRTEGGEGLICSAKVEIQPDAIKNCSAQQAGLTNTQQRDRSFDLTLGLKQLLNVTASAKYIRKATVKVTGGCLFQLSTVQAQKLLDTDPDCLRAARSERQRLSKVPLQEKLTKPGEYLLMWQTTRVFHADVEYTVDFTAGANASVKTEAAKAIKDMTGSVSGSITNTDKLELKGSGLWIGLAPRYYEQWYRSPDEEKIVSASVEKLARSMRPMTERNAPRSFTRASSDIKKVESAGEETDRKLDAAIKAAPSK
jgi:hypothetical protein